MRGPGNLYGTTSLFWERWARRLLGKTLLAAVLPTGGMGYVVLRIASLLVVSLARLLVTVTDICHGFCAHQPRVDEEDNIRGQCYYISLMFVPQGGPKDLEASECTLATYRGF